MIFEVRGRVARERDEGDVFAAGTLDVAAADDALTVGEQDDLEQHGWWVGGSACGIVAESGIQAGQVDLVIEQVIHCMFDGVGQELSLQVHRDEARAGVDVFVARHLFLRKCVLQFDLYISFGSRQDAGMKRLFLQPRWAQTIFFHHQRG